MPIVKANAICCGLPSSIVVIDMQGEARVYISYSCNIKSRLFISCLYSRSRSCSCLFSLRQGYPLAFNICETSSILRKGNIAIPRRFIATLRWGRSAQDLLNGTGSWGSRNAKKCCQFFFIMKTD